jgi:hypothetical protein
LAAETAKMRSTTRTEINRMKMGSTMLCLLDSLEVIIDMIKSPLIFILSSLFPATITE